MFHWWLTLITWNVSCNSLLTVDYKLVTIIDQFTYASEIDITLIWYVWCKYLSMKLKTLKTAEKTPNQGNWKFYDKRNAEKNKFSRYIRSSIVCVGKWSQGFVNGIKCKTLSKHCQLDRNHTLSQIMGDSLTLFVSLCTNPLLWYIYL